MKNALNTLNTPAASAEALAANFQVSELEPRLENGWSADPEPSEPSCIKTNTCAEPL